MGEILDKDHKIYGFHFLGNDGGYIDFRGHLRFRDEAGKMYVKGINQDYYQHRINSVNIV